ncbi:MAG: prolyl oligopeptidase family serine peptidase, partial [Pseudomonadota bacterium]
MTRSLIAMLLAILCLTSAASEKRPVSAVDFVASPILSSPRLSPDGKLLLYRHIGVDWDENKSVARLRLKDVHTNALLAVPEPESAGESFSAGEWHPDGSGFALILKRDGDEHRQLYFFDHQSKQLTRLTQHANDIESFFWSVDGAHIFIIAESAQDPAQARLQEDEWVIAEYDDARHREIIQLDVATKTTREIVAGDYSVRRVSLSRDGAHLVYVRVPNHELNRSHEGDVWVTNIASGEHQRWTQNDFSEYDPQLASDGKTLAFMATVNAKGAPYYEDKVFVQRGRDATPERLLGDKAMEAIAFAWDADSSGLFIMANIGVSSQLFHYQLESGELTQVTDGSHSFRGWHYDVALDQHVARHVTADAPGDIVAIDASAKTITPLTRESRDWAAQFELPEQVAVSWRGRGRVTIEGLLVYPLGYEKDKGYPLVTIAHGGPRSSSQFGSWNRSRYVSVLAGLGYAVLLPNHRGGTGYGDDFMRDMYGRYFRNAHHDVMDGIDAMVARGIADPDRLIAMGWSAGGH